MTVCIAAIYDKGIIVVTDMVRTDAGTDRSREIPMSKIFVFSKNIIALIADDMALQAEVLETTMALLKDRFPNDIFKVKDVVNCFAEAYATARLERLLTNVLVNFGYTTLQAWQDGQNGLDVERRKEIDRRMEAFKMPGTIETIIAGIDEDGPHLWRLNGEDQLNCNDYGFVSIGQGEAEISYQFHKLGYDRTFPELDVMFISYVAKARSEDFLGVGDATVFGKLTQDDFVTLKREELPRIYELYEAMEIGVKYMEQCTRNLFAQRVSMLRQPNENGKGRSKGRSVPKKDIDSDNTLTEQAFLENLKKATRRISPPDREKKET